MFHYRLAPRLIAAALGACVALSAAALAGESSNTAMLTVEVDGLSSSGPVYFALWNSKSDFLSSSPLKSVKKPVDHGQAVWTIEQLPYGHYAVSAYQDLNGNGKLDSNTFGAPVEPVGMSNNAVGHFGPPDYSDARINLNKTRVRLKIKLSCPMGCADK